MRYNKSNEYICNSLAEVKVATKHLDIAVERPIKVDDGGVIKDVNNFKGIYNLTKGMFCASVVSHYNVITHKEYFDGFAEALNNLGIKYKMVVKQQGNRAFADITFEDRNVKFEKLDEEFATGIRLINSYNKTYGLYAMLMYTRLACLNGMVLTRSEKSVSVKHHSKVAANIQVFIEKRLNTMITQNLDLQNWVSTSMKDSIEWQTCCGIIAKMFTQLKHREEILKRLNISVIQITNKKTKKKSVQYVWDDKTKKKDKITRWEIHNSITEYISHGEQITPHINNLFQHYAEKLLITPLKDMPKVEVVI